MQIFGESVYEVGRRSSRSSRGPVTGAPELSLLNAVSLVIAGAGMGLVTTWVVPTRLFPAGPVPGLSLIVSPVLNGILMGRYGEWCERRGRRRTALATFWGGVLFAFSMALVRFGAVGY